MGIPVNKNENRLGLKVESTEGTYNAMSGSSDFVEVLADAANFTIERDEIERDILSSTVEIEASRVGIKNVNGTIPVEYRANSTAGSAPVDLDLLLRSLMGGKRQNAAADTTTTGNSSTVLNFTSHDIEVGDIVLVKEAGAYELRPVSAKDATSITFPFALDNGAPSDGVEVEKFTTYYFDSTNSVTLSAEHTKGDLVQQQVAGLRVGQMSLSDFTVGSTPKAEFTLEGTSMSESVSASTADPAANSALPPIVLNACLWLNGVKLEYQNFGLTVTSELAPVQSACADSGRIATRITKQMVEYTIDPYMEDDDVDRFTLFDQNNDASLFVYAYNPSSTAGEFSQAVGFWVPQSKIISKSDGDADGLYIDEITGKAHRSAGNDSIFLGFI